MSRLTLTRTDGISIGALPLPDGWTTDVSSHVVPCCVRPAAPGAAAPQPVSFYEGTMNVVRCESCDRLGDTIYFTEYFRPRLYNQSSRSAARTLGDEDMQKVLQGMPPYRPERPQLLARVVEITDDDVPVLPPSRQPRLPFSTLLRGDGTEEELPISDVDDMIIHTAVDCIAARLLPSYWLFIQVVLDTVDGSSLEAERMAEEILHEAKKRYVQPLLELSHFRAVIDPRAGLVQVKGGEPGTRHLDRAAAEEEALTRHLREICSPLTLTARSMPAMGVFCKSARTVMGFRRLYTTRLTGSTEMADGSRRAHSERVDVSLFHTYWNVGRQHGQAPDGSRTTSTESLRRLVKHGLKLPSEDLVVEIPLRMLAQERTSAAMLHPIALATLPVGQDPRFSLYNYRSVEAIVESHIAARSLVARDGWTLTPIPLLHGASRFVPSAAFVDAMKAQDSDTVVPAAGDKDEKPAPPTSDQINNAWGRATSAAGRIPPRCSFYAFEPRAAATKVDGTKEGDADEQMRGYVIAVIAPRVQSCDAVLVITPLHPIESLTWHSCGRGPSVVPPPPSSSSSTSSSASSTRTALLHATCNFMIDEMIVSTPLTSEWGSLCLPSAETLPGSVFRQGELVIEVPAGDARYRNAVVVPTAAYYFTTRGSMTLYTQPSMAPAAASQDPSARAPSPVSSELNSPSLPPFGGPTLDRAAPFACLSAVWTVIADGRSAAEYVDYTISEYQYDLGVKNLANVGARSQLDRPGTLVVRQRKRVAARAPRKGPIGAVTATAPAPKNRTNGLSAAPAKASGESWSVWLDIGTVKRLFLLVSESGLGQLVVVQAALPALPQKPASMKCGAAQAGSAAATTTATRDEDEVMLEEWVQDVPVAVLPRL